MGIWASILAAISLLSFQPEGPKVSFSAPPEVNLSAIRLITCDDETYGTGWMIADNIVVTANHVVTPGPCKDAATGLPLRVYHRDEEHDLALVTAKLPEMSQYIKYACTGYQTGKEYRGYGYSGWGQPGIIFRQNKVVATGGVSDESFKIRGYEKPFAGMKHLRGWVVPGNSGGPFLSEGVAYGLTNVGEGGGSLIRYRTENNWSYELKDTILCRK